LSLPVIAAADELPVYKVPIGNSPARGPAEAEVTVIEFSDYQCPFCLRAQGVLQQLAVDYAGHIRFVFKNSPLPFHARALPAALASVAAGRQGKFWEMHDRLFANQAKPEGLGDAALEQLAAELGLDLLRFKQDLADPGLRREVEADTELAHSLGASGTPTFFINGALAVGAIPLADFKSRVDAAMLRAKAKLAEGVAPAGLYEALIAHGKLKQEAPLPKVELPRKIALDKASPRRGAKDAKVVIVEFADFQCPFCGRAAATMNELLAAYPDDVALVWMNEPMPYHPEALTSAKAAMAAHRQGKFWEMHDLIFANRSAMSAEAYERWAALNGLDLARWRTDMSSARIAADIRSDQKEAEQVGATGTPAFFLNGIAVHGAQDYLTFKAVIEDQIAKAIVLQERGTSQAALYDAMVDANLKEANLKATKPTER
jgi:protein-disulfide isomerase